jgi:hypothetical protein
MEMVLKDRAKVSAFGDPLAFLKIHTVFGDLIHTKHFVDTYLTAIENIRKYGIIKVIGKLI